MPIIYHITSKDWWQKWTEFEYYESPTFEQETFIHLSTAEQVSGVLERYYAGQNDLLKLHIDTDKLLSKPKYEQATNEEYFPHLYDRINKNAISVVEELD